MFFINIIILVENFNSEYWNFIIFDIQIDINFLKNFWKTDETFEITLEAWKWSIVVSSGQIMTCSHWDFFYE